MGHCPIVVYVRQTHDGILARGVVQATGQTMTHVARRYVVRHHVVNIPYRKSVDMEKKVAYAKYADVKT